MPQKPERGDEAEPRSGAGRLHLALGRLARNRHLVMLLLSIVLGTAASVLAILFRELYGLFQLAAFGTRSEALYTQIAGLTWWHVLLAPAAGGLLVGLFIHRVMPDRRPHGVADAIEAVARRSGHIDARSGIGAALASAASIGVGASVGREGPVVHLGAAACSLMARRIGLSRTQTVTLVGCGVAAAVAASFNAPIAGVFFALEVVVGHYALSAFAPIVLASVAGTVLTRISYGNFPAFVLSGQSIASLWEFPAFVLLGLVGAVAAIALLRGVALSSRVAAALPLPPWALPGVAGLFVGVIALALPQVLGVGYGSTDQALKGLMPLELLIALIVAKTAATSVCLGFGFGGGIFSPSLFIGAMLGGAFGMIAGPVFPDLASANSVYTLVGMGAVAGAVLGAPISTILIVFELSGDYAVTTAVMVAVVIASVLTQHLHGPSFFHWQLAARGINIEAGREMVLVESIRVADLMRPEYAAVAPGAGMREVRASLQAAPHGELFVLDEAGRLQGTITLSDLSEMAFDTSHDDVLNAADVARTHPPVLAASDGLSAALRLMQTSGEEHIGVVDAHDSMRLVGFVHEVDVVLAYNRAFMQARADERTG